MKLKQTPGEQAKAGPRRGPQPEAGFVTILILALLSIMLILISSNARAISSLQREIKLIDQREKQKFSVPATNAAQSPPEIPRREQPAE